MSEVTALGIEVYIPLWVKHTKSMRRMLLGAFEKEGFSFLRKIKHKLKKWATCYLLM